MGNVLVIERGAIPMLESFKAALQTALRKPLPDEAKTKYGDGLTGYKVQAFFDRLNSVLGINNWSYSYQEMSEEEVNGGMGFLKSVDVTISVPVFGLTAHATGVYTDFSKAGALRGAITNGLKAVCSKFFGIGGDAYLGLVSLDEETEKLKVQPPAPSTVAISDSLIPVDPSLFDKPEEPKPEVKDEPKAEAAPEPKAEAAPEPKVKKPKKQPVQSELAAELEAASSNGNGHTNDGDSH